MVRHHLEPRVGLWLRLWVLLRTQNNWNELFPIESHPHWAKVMDKLSRYERQLDYSESEYNSLFNK